MRFEPLIFNPFNNNCKAVQENHKSRKMKNSMLMKKLMFAASTTIICAGCSLMPQPKHYVKMASPIYDPVVSSRIRILSANGPKFASFSSGKDCYTPFPRKDDSRIVVNDGGYFEGYKYSSTSLTIGMPASPRTWMRTDGLNFKDFIKEYVVSSEKPLIVGISSQNYNGNTYVSCSPPQVIFMPKPGRDYDIFMNNRRRQCWISVRQINEKGDDIPVKLEKANECKSDAATNPLMDSREN